MYFTPRLISPLSYHVLSSLHLLFSSRMFKLSSISLSSQLFTARLCLLLLANFYVYLRLYEGKDKAVHNTPMEPKGGEEYSSYSFDLGTKWGEWSASRPGRTLCLGEGAPVPIVQEAGWDPEPVWTQRLEGKVLSPLLRIQLPTLGRPALSQALY
jgi:hypothetical protein